MDDLKQLAAWMRAERQKRGWSTAQLAARVGDAARRERRTVQISQQTISSFEQGNAKREPSWLKFVAAAFRNSEPPSPGETISSADDEQASQFVVYVPELPTHAGAGGGGTGEGEEGTYPVPRVVMDYELRATSRDILSVVIEGNSMDPDFQSGDRVLVDRRKTTLAQPGAFCLWDGDGYVVKYLEKVPGSEPPKVRVISRNSVFSTFERLVDEVRIMGRVVWFARKV